MHRMTPATEPFDLPPWAAFGLRLARRAVVVCAFLLTLFIVLETIAFQFFPERSTRFLIEGESNGQPAWVDNPFFAYRFFPGRTAPSPLPVVALKTPAKNTLRICLLGGSAAMGMPDPAFGLGRQLERMLQQRYPDRPVEVIPMGLDDGNSHVLREVARELGRLKPHAVIVLAGNDEVPGPYGPAAGLGRFHHSSRIARWMTLFSRTHLSQLFIATLNRTFPARVDLNAWRSQEPITLRGRMAPKDPRLKTVQRSFRKNLAAILKAASRNSPVVIACTVPVNLRDCAPFSTTFLNDEAAAQEVRETLRAAMAAEAATNRFEAARLYAKAIHLDPTHAEALFRAARMALNENRTAEAAALFSRARDADALRLRTDSRLNAIIRECAAEQGVDLLDAENLFAIRSPQGIPGRELFLDHIHYTFEANHLLASAVLHRMEFLNAFDTSPAARIPTVDEMASEMLYHPWGRAAQLEALVRQQLRPPFRRQLTNTETLARLNEDSKRWNARLAAISPDNTRAIFARRQASRPGDAWLAGRAAWHLLQAGDPARAEAAASAAYAHWPHRFDIRALLALTRAHQGQDAASGIALLRGDNADTGYYDINLAISIGRDLYDKKKFEQSFPWLDYALGRDPWNSEAAIVLAENLYRLDQSEKAIHLLKEAIERNPRNPLLWEELAVLYTLLGNWNIANECYAKSEELAPYRYERLLKWAEAMVRLRQYHRANRHVARYLTIMPEDPDALALQQQIQAHLPSQPESPAESPARTSGRRFPWE
jgi:tetratricopeptide (TPR) repeat protein